MKVLDTFFRLIMRFRYPNSLPEDVSQALGVPFSNFLTFEEFVSRLSSPTCCPTKLKRYMPRDQAEAAFGKAQKRERFSQNTLCSYYFNNKGWMEFNLKFDTQKRLRRVYLQHKEIQGDAGIELPLAG